MIEVYSAPAPVAACCCSGHALCVIVFSAVFFFFFFFSILTNFNIFSVGLEVAQMTSAGTSGTLCRKC